MSKEIEQSFSNLKIAIEELLSEMEDNLRVTPVSGMRWSCAFAAWSDTKEMMETLAKVKQNYDTSRKDESWEANKKP